MQLFSAIEKHKRLVQKKISESRSVMEREKILETTGKEAFLEVLRQQGKKVKLSQEEEFVQQVGKNVIQEAGEENLGKDYSRPQ